MKTENMYLLSSVRRDGRDQRQSIGGTRQNGDKGKPRSEGARADDGKCKSRAAMLLDALSARFRRARERDGVDQVIRYLRGRSVATASVERFLDRSHRLGKARLGEQPVIARKEAGVQADRGTQ